MMKLVRQWHRLTRDVVDSPSLKAFKNQTGWGFEQLGQVKDVPVHSRGWNLMIFNVPSNLIYAMLRC